MIEESKDLKLLSDLVLEKIRKAYDERETYEDPESLKGLERFIVIRAVDRLWQDHLTEMEELRLSLIHI